MSEGHDSGVDRKKIVRIVTEKKVDPDRIRDYIDANTLPGDKVVIEDPDGGEQVEYIYDDE